ncbi:hypothetical protein [uncultured Trichococcus sp.]|nr:hypothetical protein [uncultured Trichococcus sp.]
MDNKKLFMFLGQFGLEMMDNRKIFIFSAPTGNQFNVGNARKS